MRVLITGATGFVGSHTAAAVAAAGHDVRVLARDPSRVAPALDPLGVGAVDVAVGDVTDADAVARAVDGCDAVIHAAAVFSTNPRERQRIIDVNVRATDTVLFAADTAGCDPIVHVSSNVALLPARPGDPMSEQSEPTPDAAPGVYVKSKADSERVAREFQDQGAPVVITYPGGVLGPHDPYLGENNHRIVTALRGLIPTVPRGAGIHLTDVRDVAAVHAAVLQPGLGPRRFIVPGHFTTSKQEMRALAELTGRRLPVVELPVGAVLPAAAGFEALMRLTPLRYPGSREAVWIAGRRSQADTSRAERELGVTPRPFQETLADTIRWLVAAGHLKPRLAGKLANPESVAV